MQKRRVRITQIQRKRGKTETESSPQAIYRADVVLVMLLIIEVVVGVRLHPPPSPRSVSLFLALSLSLLPFGSWLTALYPLSAITPEDVISSFSTPQLSVVASKGKRRTWEEEGQRWGKKMSPCMCFLEIPHRTTVCVPDD